jgi:hypothetical protein
MKLACCTSIEDPHLISKIPPFNLSFDYFKIMRRLYDRNPKGMETRIIELDIILSEDIFKLLQIELFNYLDCLREEGIVIIFFTA